MKDRLNIACWNARGIMPGSVFLSHYLTKMDIDIIGISEHWLFPQSLIFLNYIDANYEYYTKCDNDLTLPLDGATRRRGKGGVAFLWHKRISKYRINIYACVINI